jgi:hypothetical protein
VQDRAQPGCGRQRRSVQPWGALAGDRDLGLRQQGGERLVVETLDGQGLVDVEEMVI